MTSTPTTSVVARARRSLQVRSLITSCTQCPLHTNARPNPVPFSAPPPSRTPRYVVLGEAPGRIEQRRQRPFVGPSGRLLRKMLVAAGVNLDDGLWMNTVCCCPFGPPPTVATFACRPHMKAQFALAPGRPVLAAGQVALHALFPDAQIGRLTGCGLRYGEGDDARDVIPTYHPSYLLRDPTARPELETALANFSAVVAGLDASFFTANRCHLCRSRPNVATAWDDRLMPFCDTHKGEIRRAVNRAARQRKALNRASQQRMEI